MKLQDEQHDMTPLGGQQGAPVIHFEDGEEDTIFLQHPDGRMVAVVVKVVGASLKVLLPDSAMVRAVQPYLRLHYDMPQRVEGIGGAVPRRAP